MMAQLIGPLQQMAQWLEIHGPALARSLETFAQSVGAAAGVAVPLVLQLASDFLALNEALGGVPAQLLLTYGALRLLAGPAVTQGLIWLVTALSRMTGLTAALTGMTSAVMGLGAAMATTVPKVA